MTPLHYRNPVEGEEEGIREHEFEVKTTEGKFGKMKGVTREKVSLLQYPYEEVRNSFTHNMESDQKMLFLSHFPKFRRIQNFLFRKRREIIPSNPKNMTELNVDLPMFQFNKDETVVKGDQVLSDGRRVVMFSTNFHLKLLAKTEEALADGTFRTTPPPWKQSFIISAKVTSDDAMFSMVAENLECRGLELSATYFMSGRT